MGCHIILYLLALSPYICELLSVLLFLQEGLNNADKDNEELKNGITNCVMTLNRVSSPCLL